MGCLLADRNVCPTPKKDGKGWNPSAEPQDKPLPPPEAGKLPKQKGVRSGCGAPLPNWKYFFGGKQSHDTHSAER